MAIGGVAPSVCCMRVSEGEVDVKHTLYIDVRLNTELLAVVLTVKLELFCFFLSSFFFFFFTSSI